jgi:hypothetical protein
MRSLFCAMLICMLSSVICFSQPDRWQQRVKYSMDINMDVHSNQFTGKQRLEYFNNSPDTLYKLFYHLYWNAFQPNSMMDMRSRELGKIKVNGRPDWDGRVRDRISKLKPDEIGYQKVLSLKMDGVNQTYKVDETILEVLLSRPILPRSKVTLDMEFEAQVPLQVRRSGRDNPNTGVRYSMSQWYPKLCEYDYEGWHPTPYVAREFYGVWGDYEVKITIDKSYIIGGTGYLMNANQIGYGYETAGARVVRPAGNTLTWNFVAPNVHDFVWAADPKFKHLVRNIPNGPTINVLYKARENDPNYDESWKQIADAAVMVLPYIQKRFGKYPYKQYSFIHGGDGGMEYPMATLLSGPGLGTAFHEWMHSWYQGMFGTNESLYAWMDEGFTEYASAEVEAFYYAQPSVRKRLEADPRRLQYMDSVDALLPLRHYDQYQGYLYLAKSEWEEPLTTHADHFNTNFAYSLASYSKGAVFMAQLGYIIGEEIRDKVLLEYYRLWRFKHPNANDFLQVAEKVSGLKLDWYKEYWIATTKTIDYGIDSLWEEAGKTKIRLKMTGKVPMPLDVMVQYKNGDRELAYIPQYLMFGEKPVEDKSVPRISFEPWKWTNPTYTIELNHKLTEVKSVEIDPTRRMADVNRENNRLELNW